MTLVIILGGMILNDLRLSVVDLLQVAKLERSNIYETGVESKTLRTYFALDFLHILVSKNNLCIKVAIFFKYCNISCVS